MSQSRRDSIKVICATFFICLCILLSSTSQPPLSCRIECGQKLTKRIHQTLKNFWHNTALFVCQLVSKHHFCLLVYLIFPEQEQWPTEQRDGWVWQEMCSLSELVQPWYTRYHKQLCNKRRIITISNRWFVRDIFQSVLWYLPEPRSLHS